MESHEPTPLIAGTEEARTALRSEDLVPPFLVSIGYGRMGISNDWLLCESVAEVEAAIAQASRGTRIDVQSVWNLIDVPSDVVIQKP